MTVKFKKFEKNYFSKPTQNLRIFALVLFFCFQSVFISAQNKSTISIDSAQKSEYKKDPVSGDDCIVLSGGVVVSVTRGSSKTSISAEFVNYNRTTEMIFAQGNVFLEQTGGSAGGEKISAGSLLFNTATMEGVFDNGRAVQASSDAINLPSGSTLIVASDVFGRDSGGTITFKSGELTFCDDENPHWRIKASRIWLLPGGEFAFLSAVLFVGRVPLIWLPAFYYPKDELIFNPTFGYKQREGYFFNNTIYLYGRKPANAKSTAELNTSSSSSSNDEKINFFSFMKTGDMKKQRREGLILHNLDEDFSGDTSNYFKIMADYYANLGAMVGFDGSFKPNDYITNITTNLELGFSNTIFKTENAEYLPKDSMGNEKKDSSDFLSMQLPFRYQANFKFTLAKPFSLTLSMPIYSDPYFSYDFNNRAETMDWIDFAMNGQGNTETDLESKMTETSSFTWSLSGSYNIKVPEILNPFVSSISISNFSSQMVFSSKVNGYVAENSASSVTSAFSNALNDFEKRDAFKLGSKYDSEWSQFTPERKFYYPSQITPFKISGKISGTLAEVPYTKKTSDAKKQAASPSISPPEYLMTEEELEKKREDEAKRAEERLKKEKGEEDEKAKDEPEEETEEESEEEDESTLPEKALPALATSSFSTKKSDNISYKLDYSISPDYSSQINYSAEKIYSSGSFDFENIQSTYYQFRSPTVLTSKVGYKDSFLSLTNSFTFSPVFQDHPYMNDSYYETENVAENVYHLKNTTTYKLIRDMTAEDYAAYMNGSGEIVSITAKKTLYSYKTSKSYTEKVYHKIGSDSYKPYKFMTSEDIQSCIDGTGEVVEKTFSKDEYKVNPEKSFNSSGKSIKNADNSARKLDVTNTNALTFKPFYLTEHFSETSLTWNTTINVIKTKYISDDPNNPEWEYLTTDFTDPDFVTTHNLNLNLAAKEGKFTQSLSLTTTLPPQVDEYKGVLTLGFPYGSLSAGTGIKKKSSTDDTWVKQDFSETLTLNMFNSKLKFNQSYVYNLEEDRHDSLKFSLSGFGLQLAYTMSYASGFTFDVTRSPTTGEIISRNGWITTTEKKTSIVYDDKGFPEFNPDGSVKTVTTTVTPKEFRPYQLSLAYTSGSKTFKYWKDRISFAPSLSTSVVYDFLKPTGSYFKFIPGLTFKINDFFNITFSMESRNNVIYRYFCKEDDYDFYYNSSGERNVLKDLVDSFRFDDESKRKSSGFKLQNFVISITHELHDWDFNATFKIEPKLISATTTTDAWGNTHTTSARYDFSPYMSLSVAWRPLSSMKTQIVDDRGEWKLNP